mgnify:CR=1 FL=1
MNILDEIKSSFKSGSIITRLIYTNLFIFILIRLLSVVFYLFKIDLPLLEWLALPSDISLLITRPWTLITYMFVHYDFLHILFNLLCLYWFGKIFLMYFDERKLLSLYFLGGIAGGIFYILAFNIFPAFAEISKVSSLIGASASIIAILIAAAIYAPNFSVNLLLISSIFGPVKLIWIAVFSILIYIVSITGVNPGGNIAHIGGAIWGMIYMSGLKRGKDITLRFNNFLYNFSNIFKRRSKLRVSHNKNTTRNMSDWEYNKTKKAERQNINEILDKIGKSGYDSLSKSEKEFLFKMGNKKNNPGN